jgi:uncharacterized protein (DUF302 family)
MREDVEPSGVDRRSVLQLAALVGATTALSGCQNEADQQPTTSAAATRTDEPTTTETTTADGQTTGGFAAGDGLVTVAGGDSVAATVDRIEADIEASPLTLVTTIDHAANAASVDADLPPTRLLVFGNPAVGTPLMGQSRTVGIDLPQKLLVWEADDGSVNVTYTDPAALAARHGIEEQDERLETIATTLDRLATGGR